MADRDRDRDRGDNDDRGRQEENNNNNNDNNNDRNENENDRNELIENDRNDRNEINDRFQNRGVRIDFIAADILQDEERNNEDLLRLANAILLFGNNDGLIQRLQMQDGPQAENNLDLEDDEEEDQAHQIQDEEDEDEEELDPMNEDVPINNNEEGIENENEPIELQPNNPDNNNNIIPNNNNNNNGIIENQLRNQLEQILLRFNDVNQQLNHIEQQRNILPPQEQEQVQVQEIQPQPQAPWLFFNPNINVDLQNNNIQLLEPLRVNQERNEEQIVNDFNRFIQLLNDNIRLLREDAQLFVNIQHENELMDVNEQEQQQQDARDHNYAQMWQEEMRHALNMDKRELNQVVDELRERLQRARNNNDNERLLINLQESINNCEEAIVNYEQHYNAQIDDIINNFPNPQAPPIHLFQPMMPMQMQLQPQQMEIDPFFAFMPMFHQNINANANPNPQPFADLMFQQDENQRMILDWFNNQIRINEQMQVQDRNEDNNNRIIEIMFQPAPNHQPHHDPNDNPPDDDRREN